MKQKMKRKNIVCLTLILILSSVFSLTASATQSRSKNFKTVALGSDQGANLVAVAMAQKNKTKKQLGYTEAWCADFVLDCARVAKIPNTVIPFDYPSGGGCGYLYNYMLKKCGAVQVSTPQKGDLVFYYCNANKAYTHVGICQGNGRVIEGNVSGKVNDYAGGFIDSHGHSVASRQVTRLYLHPNYSTPITSCSVQISNAGAYTGAAITPQVTVTYGKTVLKNGTDYSLAFSNNVNAGTAAVTITGKGKYTGTVKKNFVIAACSINSLSFSQPALQTYTGKQLKPASSVMRYGKALKSGKDYTVKYGANKNCGLGSITFSGKGNYTGTKVISFYIAPKPVTNVKGSVLFNSVTVSFKGSTGATGYEISYRKSGSKNWSSITIMSLSKKLSLSHFTKYELRVRPFVQVKNGKNIVNVCGAWSNIITKTTI